MATSQPIARAKLTSIQGVAHKRLDRLFLLAILALAVYLRFAALDYSLPLIYGDENPIGEHALALRWSDPNPHMFYYGSLTFYIFKSVSVVANIANQFFSGYPLDFPAHILVLRYVCALASLVTVCLVAVLGKLAANARVGLLSAAIAALSPLAIDLAHTATVDALLGVWSTLALIGMAMWLREHKFGPYLAAMGVGLAISTKFNAIVLLLPIVTITIYEARRDASRELSPAQRTTVIAVALAGMLASVGVVLGRATILEVAASWSTRGQLLPAYVAIFDRLIALLCVAAIGACTLALGVYRRWHWSTMLVRALLGARFLRLIAITCTVFALTSPFVLLDYPEFIRDFFFQIHKSADNTTVAYEVGSRSYQAALQSLPQADRLQYLAALKDEWGLPVFVALAIGLWGLWRASRVGFAVFGALAILGLVMTLGWSYLALRWLYPFWAIFALLGGLGISIVYESLSRRVGQLPAGQVIAGVLMLLAFALPIKGAIDSVNRNYVLPDTRNLALAWIHRNIPPGATVLRELGTPNLELVSSDYQVYATDTAFEERPLSEWRGRGVTVIMLSDRRYQFYRDHAPAFQDVLSSYREVMTRWSLVQSFPEGPTMRGMSVYIYRLPGGNP